MTIKEVMAELESYGEPNIKKILMKHGVKEPLFGVKVEKLKIIEKKVKKDYQLAKNLYATGNADAMYLAGLIADDAKMTKEDLQEWVKGATSDNICGYTVPWVAAGSRYGFELAMEWIDSEVENIASAGWNTLGGLAALKPDTELDLPVYKKLIDRVAIKIHSAKNREGYAMNGFIISAGTYIKSLTEEAKKAAEKIGKVTVEMNCTACKVPDAVPYIDKAISKGQHGKKKKVLKC